MIQYIKYLLRIHTYYFYSATLYRKDSVEKIGMVAGVARICLKHKLDLTTELTKILKEENGVVNSFLHINQFNEI
jgi:hypothetical protein